MMDTQDKLQHARENAQGWLESIHEMVDRLEHAQECNEEPDGDCSLWPEMEFKWRKSVSGEMMDYDDYHDADKAREAIEESVLALEVTGKWRPGDTPIASGYEILLTTGGPALRIVGDLGRYSSPSSAWLEMQDWGTPWTRVDLDADDLDALIKFASVFYFGD